MYGYKKINIQSQRGVSLSGLIIVLGIIIGIAVLAMKVFPSVLEYRSIKEGVTRIKGSNGTPAEMRAAYENHRDVNSISSLLGQDLIITKVNNETQIAFAYDKRIDLFDKVYLVIEYSATTDKSGIIPEKPAVTAK